MNASARGATSGAANAGVIGAPVTARAPTTAAAAAVVLRKSLRLVGIRGRKGSTEATPRADPMSTAPDSPHQFSTPFHRGMVGRRANMVAAGPSKTTA